jgi:hypothetical protein
METLPRVDRAAKKQDSEGIPNPDKEICTSVSLDISSRKPSAQNWVEDKMKTKGRTKERKRRKENIERKKEMREGSGRECTGRDAGKRR